MADHVASLEAEFPTLVRLCGRERLARALARLAADRRPSLNGPIRSMGLVVDLARVETDSHCRERVAAIEAGLRVAQRLGALDRWRRKLCSDGAHYDDDVAELLVIGLLDASSVSVEQLERPSDSAAATDYDAHIVAEGVPVGIEIKHRFPKYLVGRIAGVTSDLRWLVEETGEFQETVILQLADAYRWTADDRIEIACLLEDTLQTLSGTRPMWRVSEANALEPEFPRRLQGSALQTLHEGHSVLLAHISGRCALYLPHRRQFELDNPLVRRISLHGGERSLYVFSPFSVLPILSRASRDAVRSSNLPKPDADATENGAVRGLLRKGAAQLPLTGTNVVVLALQSTGQREDIRLAVYGEPFTVGPPPDLRGGVFEESAFAGVAGVISFNVGFDGAPREVEWWPNPNGPKDASELAIREVANALGRLAGARSPRP